jgi:hypothetical protein
MPACAGTSGIQSDSADAFFVCRNRVANAPCHGYIAGMNMAFTSIQHTEPVTRSRKRELNPLASH